MAEVQPESDPLPRVTPSHRHAGISQVETGPPISVSPSDYGQITQPARRALHNQQRPHALSCSLCFQLELFSSRRPPLTSNQTSYDILPLGFLLRAAAAR